MEHEHHHGVPCPLVNGSHEPLRHEVLYKLVPHVVLHGAATQVRSEGGSAGGVLAVTSHRLVLADATRVTARQWRLAQVVGAPAAEPRGLLAAVFGAPRLVLHVSPPHAPPSQAAATSGAGARNYPALPPSRAAEAAAAAAMRLSFKDHSARDETLAALQRALDRAAWRDDGTTGSGDKPAGGGGGAAALSPLSAAAAETVAAAAAAASAVSAPAAAGARPGRAGLLEEQERQQQGARALATEALRGDLGSLERHAKSVVALAENYATEVAKMRIRRAYEAEAAAARALGVAGAAPVPATAPAGVSAEERAAEDAALQSVGALAADMGIVSPVTREVAGAELYLQEVARQLASVVRPRLERGGGSMLLTDAYCLYNRARGTDLVSPEDLVAAARLCGGLGLGMRERTLPPPQQQQQGGGAAAKPLRVLQLDSFSDEAMKRRVVADLRQRQAKRAGGEPVAFATAVDLAQRWAVPLPLARRHLLQAEADALLWRDDSLAGLRFYLPPP